MVLPPYLREIPEVIQNDPEVVKNILEKSFVAIDELLSQKRTYSEQLEIERKNSPNFVDQINLIESYVNKKLYNELLIESSNYLRENSNCDKIEYCLFVLGPIKTKLKDSKLLTLVIEAGNECLLNNKTGKDGSSTMADGDSLDTNIGILKYLNYWYPIARNNRESLFYYRCVQSYYLVEYGFDKESGFYLFGVLEPVLEASFGLSIESQSSFYKAALHYGMKTNNLEYIYTYGILYISTTSMNTLSLQNRQEYGFQLCKSALLNNSIQSYIELKQQPVLKDLEIADSSLSWILELLKIVDSADLKLLQEFENSHKESESHKCLKDYESIPWDMIRRKVRMLQLVLLAFNKPIGDGILTFKEIEDVCQVSRNDVELLVMDALCHKFIKGSIDGVNESLYVSKLQPRLLDQQEIRTLSTRFSNWSNLILSLSEVLNKMV